MERSTAARHRTGEKANMNRPGCEVTRRKMPKLTQAFGCIRTRVALSVPVLVIITMLVTHGTASAQKGKMMVRISEIEIHSDYLEEYRGILKEEASASVRLEPGVVAIFPMYQHA